MWQPHTKYIVSLQRWFEDSIKSPVKTELLTDYLIILVYAISDDMFQANHSYERFLHHIMDNTIKGFNDKLKTTNMASLPFPFKPRQSKDLPGNM